MQWDCISKISDVCGILGFIISVVSILFNAFILKIIKSQKREYKSNRQEHYENLQSFLDCIYKDKINSPYICDALIQELLYLNQNFSLIFKFSCKQKIKHCIKQLQTNEQNIDSKSIRNDLNYIVTRLKKKE